MVLKKMFRNEKDVKKPLSPSNVSHKSLDVLKMKVEHRLQKTELIIPTNSHHSWEDLKKANDWLATLETEVKHMFNVKTLPRLDSYAEQLITESQVK